MQALFKQTKKALLRKKLSKCKDLFCLNTDWEAQYLYIKCS